MKTKIGIVGATGYTGGELIRILASHPYVQIKSLYSRTHANKFIYEIHQDLFDFDLKFTNNLALDLDLIFLCMGHGASGDFLKESKFTDSTRIIDLSNEFRLEGDHNFIYGLPELQKKEIQSSNKIANPGCFATAIQLSLMPLAQKQAINNEVHVHAITGSTGAGKSLRETTHFTWRNNNASIYKAFNHQHLPEINQSLQQLQSSEMPRIHFVPIRGNFPRGILASVYLKSDLSEAEAQGCFKKYYEDHPFVHIIESSPNIKQVVNTNKAVINIRRHGDQLHMITAIDNLVKGASGQAVQNMNLICGYPESTGLALKPLGL